MALTLLFTLLSYMGSALYHRADGLTTVKPFGGIALALLLIYGRSWILPVLVSGTLGGIFAKIAFSATLLDSLLTPALGSATLLAIYLLSQRLIAPTIDFRAWKQLVGFIAIAACVSAVTGVLFAGQLKLWSAPGLRDQLARLVHPHHPVLCDLHAGRGLAGDH